MNKILLKSCSLENNYRGRGRIQSPAPPKGRWQVDGPFLSPRLWIDSPHINNCFHLIGNGCGGRNEQHLGAFGKGEAQEGRQVLVRRPKPRTKHAGDGVVQREGAHV